MTKQSEQGGGQIAMPLSEQELTERVNALLMDIDKASDLVKQDGASYAHMPDWYSARDKLIDFIHQYVLQEHEKRERKIRAESYEKGRNSVGGESVGEAWERGYRNGRRQYDLTDETGQYFKTREGVIEAMCIALWNKTWSESKISETRVYKIQTLMAYLDVYVNKRIEDSYKPATALQQELNKGGE